MEKEKKPGKSRKSKSNKIYNDLHEIIAEHGLHYLPAKSLHRFTAVCRDWKFQISTPFFVHSQSYSFDSISGLFFQFPECPPSFISLDPRAYGVPDPELRFLPEPVNVHASSNGLLCCQGRKGDKPYYTCNPVNKQWKKLPKPNANHGSKPALVLIFEPKPLNFSVDYKLICPFPSVDFEDAYEFEIYDSTEDEWQISSEICFGDRVLERGGIHVNGVVYWQSDIFDIVAFDLKKGRSQIIGCFPIYGILGVVDGKLCIASMEGPVITVNVLTNTYANTMHMQAESKIWEEAHKILLTCEDLELDDIFEIEGSVLATRKDVIVFDRGETIFSYDLRTQEFRFLTTTENLPAMDMCMHVAYVNSLVTLA